MSFFSTIEAVFMQLQLPQHTAKVSKMMAGFEARTGKRTKIVEGHRTAARQTEIYADSLKSRREGQGYRAAPPGRSKHQVGAATDLNIIGETVNDAAKDARNSYYRILAEEGRKVGLKPGLDFQGGDPDPYHFEEPESLEVLREVYNTRRLRLLAILSTAAVLVLMLFSSLARKAT